jgi:hypothetical protein
MSQPKIAGKTSVLADTRLSDNKTEVKGVVLEGVEFGKWENWRNLNMMRPVKYLPNGSFRTLKASGKLPELEKGSVVSTRAVTLEDQPKYIPGYTGYIRGSQHLKGRTYGELTKRALNTDYEELASVSPIPTSPQHTDKVEQKAVTDTYVGNHFTNRSYHVPGYTGHVPGRKALFGRPFGPATSEILAKSDTVQRALNDNEGYGSPLRAKKMTKMSSDPLPGGSHTEDPPVFLIPSHLRHLRYMSS